MLTTQSQILYLKFKGIKFNYITEHEAMEILETKNYFYKLNLYRDNFIPVACIHQNHKAVRYTQLDFFQLVDLASLDMQLRYIVLKMCLDIEHSIKLYILTHLSDNINDNTIIDFFSHVERYSNVKNAYDKYLGHLKHDQILFREYERYKDNLSLPFFIEHIQFGTLCWFIEYVSTKTNDITVQKLSTTLRMVKNIRNKAAHNSAILNQITLINQKRGDKKNKQVVEFVKKAGISRSIVNKRMTNYNVNDLLGMLYVYQLVVRSPKMKLHRTNELKELIVRAKKHRELYDERFVSVFQLFDKILANF